MPISNRSAHCQFPMSIVKMLSIVHNVRCPLSVIHCVLSSVRYLLTNVHCMLSIAHYPLFVIHRPLSIVPYPLSFIHCMLSIICYTFYCTMSLVHYPKSMTNGQCSLSMVHCPLSNMSNVRWGHFWLMRSLDDDWYKYYKSATLLDWKY